MQVTKLNFGQAIEAMKQGKRVAREGWNGKGMFIFLRQGTIMEKVLIEKMNTYSTGILDFMKGQERDIKALPSLCMWTAQGEILNGWLASQTDMLAEDWFIIDGPAGDIYLRAIQKQSSQTPSVGRIVHLFPNGDKGTIDWLNSPEGDCFAAIITAIESEFKVYLSVFMPKTSVPAYLGNIPHKSEAKEGQAYWDWPLIK